MEDEVVVVSVVENLAREVCIARMSTKNLSELEIFIIGDSHSYSETISTLRMIEPHEILLHDGRKGSTLTRKLELHFSNGALTTRILYISRQCYDQDRGAEMLKRVMISFDSEFLAKYTVLAGAFCLLRYIESNSNINFGRNSLRIVYRSETSNKLIIDRATAKNLELCSNLIDGNQKQSLFGFLDRTCTAVGARFLKAQLLRPLCDITTLNTRYSMVEIFLADTFLLQQTAKTLAGFPELDRMLSGLAQEPKNVTPKTVKLSIDTMIMLKSSIFVSQKLESLLAAVVIPPPCSGNSGKQQDFKLSRDLLGAILSALNHPGLVVISELICKLLLESTSFSKNAAEMRHQECFAIRQEVSGLLDVSRKTFLQSVEDIYSLAASVESELDGTKVKVVFTPARGYHLQVHADDDNVPLPETLIQKVKNKKFVSCSTLELVSLSDRASEAISNALCITNTLLHETMEQLRDNVESLLSMVDAVALIDMLRSFAEVSATSIPQLVRPELTDDVARGGLVINKGRHPVISTLQSQQRVAGGGFVPNDTVMSPVLNFMMVSGPNGAGKTVYLKQVALIIIMAQIGCFVPCEGAKIPLRDRILSRMGTTDDLENNLSTFMTEMKDNAYIVDFLTKKSLCIVDELGRGTSNLDGLGIALSVAEHLATTPAFTIFVTHYPQLQLLEKMYPGVRNVYLEAQIDVGSPSAGSLHTIHRLKAGTREVSHGYGIAMASQVNFLSRVIVNARELQATVLRLFPQLEESQKVDTSARTVIQAIAALKGTPTLTADESLRVYLVEIRGRLRGDVSASLLSLIDEMDQLDSLEEGTAATTIDTASMVANTNSGAKRAAGSGTIESQQQGAHQTRPLQDTTPEVGAGREEPLTKRKTTSGYSE